MTERNNYCKKNQPNIQTSNWRSFVVELEHSKASRKLDLEHWEMSRALELGRSETADRALELYFAKIMTGNILILLFAIFHPALRYFPFGSFRVRSTNGLRFTPPISMKVCTLAEDNA